MERPLRPAWLASTYYHNKRNSIKIIITIPDYILPMDIYNALSKKDIVFLENTHGWITNQGRYVSSEEAAWLALEANLLDMRVERLSILDFKGKWKC